MEQERQKRPEKVMIAIKKRNLIFLLIVTLLLGSGGSLAAVYGYERSQEGVRISKAAFTEYQGLKGDYSELSQLRAYITDNYYVPVDEEKLQEGIYKGLFFGIGDPYSAYLNKKEFEEIKISTTGEFSGIGVTIAPDEKGYINVVSPIDDTPAYKAGIKTGDKIIKVDGKDYVGETIDAAVAAMRGKAGSKVSVTILRSGKTSTYDLRRAKITTETVKSELKDEAIGYIRISSFEEHTAADFERELKNLKKAGAKSLVIDLRDNPGGLVDSSVSIADLLLGEGTITYTEDRKGEKVYYKSKSGKIDLPYAVLINGGSASAAEILASAIKDNGGGTLVGTTTYGKGIIQRVDALPNGDAVKLTVMQYFSPKGEVIHKKGITPDVKLELTEDDFDEEGLLKNDRQLEKAMELLR